MTLMEGFNKFELRQDLVLGIAFLFLTVFSSVRILRSFGPTLGRKVITTFNSLIFLTSSLRAVWFLIPNYLLEKSYAPTPVVAFDSPRWHGTLISELLEVVGTLTLYGVFILVACYWVHMLAKLNSDDASRAAIMQSGRRRFGTLTLFTVMMMSIALFEVINIALFLTQHFNSEQMMLCSSFMLSLVAIAIVITVTVLSHHIKTALRNLEVITRRSSQPQIRRIFAIIIAANVFFVVRVILELTLTISLLVLFKRSQSFSVLLSDRYWTLYIALKYGSEVLVLTTELIISTAIKSYDTSQASARYHNDTRVQRSANNHGINSTANQHQPRYYQHQQHQQGQQQQQQHYAGGVGGDVELSGAFNPSETTPMLVGNVSSGISGLGGGGNSNRDYGIVQQTEVAATAETGKGVQQNSSITDVEVHRYNV